MIGLLLKLEINYGINPKKFLMTIECQQVKKFYWDGEEILYSYVHYQHVSGRKKFFKSMLSG